MNIRGITIGIFFLATAAFALEPIGEITPESYFLGALSRDWVAKRAAHFHVSTAKLDALWSEVEQPGEPPVFDLGRELMKVELRIAASELKSTVLLIRENYSRKTHWEATVGSGIWDDLSRSTIEGLREWEADQIEKVDSADLVNAERRAAFIKRVEDSRLEWMNRQIFFARRMLHLSAQRLDMIEKLSRIKGLGEGISSAIERFRDGERLFRKGLYKADYRNAEEKGLSTLSSSRDRIVEELVAFFQQNHVTQEDTLVQRGMDAFPWRGSEEERTRRRNEWKRPGRIGLLLEWHLLEVVTAEKFGEQGLQPLVDERERLKSAVLKEFEAFREGMGRSVWVESSFHKGISDAANEAFPDRFKFRNINRELSDISPAAPPLPGYLIGKRNDLNPRVFRIPFQGRPVYLIENTINPLRLCYWPYTSPGHGGQSTRINFDGMGFFLSTNIAVAAKDQDFPMGPVQSRKDLYEALRIEIFASLVRKYGRQQEFKADWSNQYFISDELPNVRLSVEEKWLEQNNYQFAPRGKKKGKVT